MTIKTFKVNCSDNPILKAFNIIAKIPGFEEFFTHNIYCVLEKN